MNIFLTTGLLALSSFAIAQTSMETGREAAAVSPGIGERTAREIAWAAGLVHIEGILLLDGHWEVAGRARGGEELTVEIDVRDGRLLGDVQPFVR